MARRLLLIALVGAALIAAIYFVVLPRVSLTAVGKPTRVENWLARRIIRQWVVHNAPDERNPLAPTPENLKQAQAEFAEHCAGCHGLDGEGHNEIEADFYPPVLPLTREVQEWSDGQLYFIIAKGIRLSAMPGFESHHDRDDIWRTVLWMRHLAHLSPEEKQAIAAAMHERAERHEATMSVGHEGEHHHGEGHEAEHHEGHAHGHSH